LDELAVVFVHGRSLKMCHFHKQKYRCAYPDLQVAERRVVDAAWAAQREADANCGAGFALRTGGGDCYSAGAAESVQFAVQEQSLLSRPRLGGAGLSHAVAVYRGDAGWPSRAYLEKLVEIEPGIDFILVDAEDGHATRWSLKQLLACERTG
jgi:hypothetical protein